MSRARLGARRPTTEEVELPLADLIAQEAERAGSYDNLQRLMEEEYPTKSLDRRKLKRIADYDFSVSLRIEELRTLDKYFTRRGYSLARNSLFRFKGILGQLSEVERVVLLCGAYSGARRRGEAGDYPLGTDLDLWDFKAIGQIVHALNEHGLHPNFQIECAALREPGDDIELQEEPWIRFFGERTEGVLGTGATSVVALGSPRANRAASYMLEKMYNAPHEEQIAPLDAKLPFRFVWRLNNRQRHSKFVIDHTAWPIMRLDPAYADQLERDGRARGLYLDRLGKRRERLYRADSLGRSGKSYGIVAAQLRGPGVLWLVLAGLTAPATFGVASILGQIQAPVPRQPEVFWAAVEVDLGLRSGGSAPDPHYVEGARVLFDSTQDREPSGSDWRQGVVQ